MKTVRIEYTNTKGVTLKVGDAIIWNYGALEAPEYSKITGFSYDGSWCGMSPNDKESSGLTEAISRVELWSPLKLSIVVLDSVEMFIFPPPILLNDPNDTKF